MRCRVGTVAMAFAALAVGACSKSGQGSCGDGGTPQDDTVTVVRGSDNGPDFDECVSGQCLSLCVDERGNPGDGTRVHIVTCDRVSVEGLDAAAPADSGSPAKPDAAQVIASSVLLHIVYQVFTCTSAD